MNYEWVGDYCLSKPGAVKDNKEEWEAYRYMVGGKMFLMEGGDREGRPILSLKLEPLRGDTARNEYDCVIPGYYMNKVHWNSVYRDGNLPDDVMKSFIDESYNLIFSALSKKKQREILEAAEK
ncbi:MmcQ/YjbR family DNA-binding protein [Oscillospiraceae bacterium OttesenSCG-928-G22]|nr:MmcQ/YjbR family DNA-binding protein [Oscillospiraceae bacterium OttesenSCG-928-G22]